MWIHVQAEHAGTVVDVLVEDAKPVSVDMVSIAIPAPPPPPPLHVYML